MWHIEDTLIFNSTVQQLGIDYYIINSKNIYIQFISIDVTVRMQHVISLSNSEITTFFSQEYRRVVPRPLAWCHIRQNFSLQLPTPDPPAESALAERGVSGEIRFWIVFSDSSTDTKPKLSIANYQKSHFISATWHCYIIPLSICLCDYIKCNWSLPNFSITCNTYIYMPHEKLAVYRSVQVFIIFHIYVNVTVTLG